MARKLKSVDSILTAAVEIGSPDQRAAYLAEACGDDADLRAQVERLIKAHFLAGSFLEEPVAGDRPTEVLDALTASERLPDAINPPPNETSFDFLQPCDVPDRLGKLGPYEVIEVTGRGGMGVVFRAHDPKLNRVVAVKVLAPEFAANPTARKRFLREARAAAAVSHPHVVTIHAVEEAGNTPYLVMEYIDGQSLEDKIEREGTLQLEAILRIGSQIAAGLAAAHGQGLVHRDIKPANILLENGVERVKITDFGLARVVDDVSVTRTGDVAGTPEFMSPEQAQGLAIEHRSDLFSLGSVLYAMCTGRSPFRGDTVVAALRRVCDDVPRPIREVNPEIPEHLVSLIDRLLAKNPDERFQTAEEVAELLSRHLADLQHPTKSPSPDPLANTVEARQRTEPSVRPAWAFCRSWRRPWLVAGLVLLAVLMGLGVTEATGVTHFAATVIRIATGESTLVIKIDDPAISVTIEGEDILIQGAGTSEIRLKPGTYRLRAEKGGQPVAIEQELVSITRGGREVVNVKLLPLAAETETGEVEPPRQRDEVPWSASHPAKVPPPRQSDEVPWPAILPADAPPPAIAPFDAAAAKKHQQAWADYLGVPAEQEVTLADSVKLTMALIPPGEFVMGSSGKARARFREEARLADDQWSVSTIRMDGPQHHERITRAFWLGRHEVTVGQFRQFVLQTGYRTDAEQDGKGGGSYFRGGFLMDVRVAWDSGSGLEQTDEHPVVNVTWNDAMAFCRWLSEKEGAEFVLPSEAQWEYACRAGTTTAWYCGDSDTTLEEYAWFNRNSDMTTHPVGQLKPNGWGLYDMHGNVQEWCADRWATPYGHSPRDDLTNPSTGRPVRGGDWHRHAWNCWSAYRYGTSPEYRNCNIGFRVAAVLRSESVDESRAVGPESSAATARGKTVRHDDPVSAVTAGGEHPPKA